MAYDSTKPAGADSIQSSDQEIRANFNHIWDALVAGHITDISTPGNVLHNWHFGVVDKNMTDANAATTVITGVGFTPQVVILVALFENSSNEITMSFGGHDGTNDVCVYGAHVNTSVSDGKDATKAIVLYDDASTESQKGTVTALGADGFTITWAKGVGSPSGIASILYVCFGKGT